MAHNWIERERKLTVRRKHRKQSGRFKDKENRDKGTGRQRKLYNHIRRFREEDEPLHDEQGEYNDE